MQIGKWGNSLAVRLPKALVERFGLSEGDEIDSRAIETALEASLEDEKEKERRRKAALKALEARAWIPSGFKFNREEFYDELIEERHGRLWR